MKNKRTDEEWRGSYVPDNFRVIVRTGFDPDSSFNETPALLRHDRADTRRDGRLSLSELLRVIELYNARSGTSRTGAYWAAVGTSDGFTPSEGP